MGIRNVLLVGSVGAGKTTISRILPRLLERIGYKSHSTDLCIFHGLSYLTLAFVSETLIHILGYRYVSKRYLTLWFNNRNLFLKLYKLLFLLDVFSIQPIAFFRIHLKKLIHSMFNRRYIIIVDEHYLTGLAIHLYFSKYTGLLKLHSVYYAIVLSQIRKMAKNGLLIVLLKTPLINSVFSWLKREKIKVVDIDMIRFREVFTNLFIEKIAKSTPSIKVLRITITNPSNTLDNVPLILRAIRGAT